MPAFGGSVSLGRGASPFHIVWVALLLPIDGDLRNFVLPHLFLCSRNRLRSPTAEQVFASRPGVETASAGLAPDAEEGSNGDP